MIDQQLREHGWEADSETLRYAADARPAKNRFLAIAEWPTDSGPADYALFSGMQCIAIVEAKRQRRNVSGAVDQAERYSRGMCWVDGAEPAGGPWGDYRNINVRWFGFDLQDLLMMKFTPSEEGKYSLQDGDILVCDGGEPGRAAVWQDERPDLRFQKALHRVRPSARVRPEWIVCYLYFLAQTGRLEKHFTGSTIKHLPQKVLARIGFPVPSLAVQAELVEKIDAAFESMDQVLEEQRRITDLLDPLEQAVLAKAFRGELVPQDADDEPAAALLERIRAARAAQPDARRRQKRR